MVDVDGKGKWKDCVDVTGLRLPTGYFFGASSLTGDLSGRTSVKWNFNDRRNTGDWRFEFYVNCLHITPDNHDIISMKLYQLTVERSPEEEEEEEDEVLVPRIDNMEQFQGRSRTSSWLNSQYFL